MKKQGASLHDGLVGHDTDLGRLEAAVEYPFRERQLLTRALTHRSFANEHTDDLADNQRLEFLGDAVLGLIVAQELFRRFPTADEGFLSGVQASIVRESALREVADSIDLGRFLRLGKGEELSGGREKPSVLADAYEALLAAIYLDGGLNAARSVILKLHQERFAEPTPGESPEDNKSKLQRLVQSGSTTRPNYHIVEEHGPAHDRTFVAEVRVDGEVLGRGEGRTKKEAQQRAASAALRYMDD